MNVNDMFPSKYLNGNDLKGRSVTARISRIASVTMPDRETHTRVKKHVLYFAGKDRGVVLKRTTAMQIAEALGTPETDRWVGQYVELYPATIDAFGATHCVVNFRRATKIPQAPAPTVNTDTGEIGQADDDTQ